MTVNDGWVTGITEGYLTKTIKFGNFTIEINRPILTADEIAKREDTVRRALTSFGRSTKNG
jgi:hypothetical protein